MKQKGNKLPSVNVEGTSDAVVAFRNGRIVKVCGQCGTELDRATGRCPSEH